MRIYATLTIKNEADIIEHSLEQALTWADQIFVLDNGSTDRTREIVEGFDARVIFLGAIITPFVRGLRSIAFNYVNQTNFCPRADWWCKMDADEVYYDDPRSFLEKVPFQFSRVCTNTIEFVELRKDVEDLLSPTSYKTYIPLDWSESRFVRNIRGLRWDNMRSGDPSGIGAVYPKRIRVLHFPFRTAEQIGERISMRKDNRDKVGIGWPNSSYRDAADLLESYKASSRRRNEGRLEFGSSARNFLASPRSRIGNAGKLLLYKFGWYR